MSEPSASKQPIYQRPVEILQNLIRFDTTNPPGNEAECVAYINSLLREAGFETIFLAKDPNRPNLIARLKAEAVHRPFCSMDMLMWSQPLDRPGHIRHSRG